MMNNEDYISVPHWGMFRKPIEPVGKRRMELAAERFVPLSAYKERIEMIPIVEVRA